jgi:hypothetical protein
MGLNCQAGLTRFGNVWARQLPFRRNFDKMAHDGYFEKG